MDQQSVFFEEWMRSLREQYKYVVRSRDRVTLPSLRVFTSELSKQSWSARNYIELQ